MRPLGDRSLVFLSVLPLQETEAILVRFWIKFQDRVVIERTSLATLPYCDLAFFNAFLPGCHLIRWFSQKDTDQNHAMAFGLSAFKTVIQIKLNNKVWSFKGFLSNNKKQSNVKPKHKNKVSTCLIMDFIPRTCVCVCVFVYIHTHTHNNSSKRSNTKNRCTVQFK